MNHNDWLDIDVLEDYLDGKLDAKTMHSVERLSLEDPFVAEALAGLSQSRKRTQSLSLLQKQLQERIAQKPAVEKRWRITSQRLSIAAAAAVLFVVVSVLFWMKQAPQKTGPSQAKQVDLKIAPQVADKTNIGDVPTGAQALTGKPINTKDPAPVVARLRTRTEAQNLPTAVASAPGEKADSIKPVAVAVSSAPQVVSIPSAKVAAKQEQVRETALSGKVDGIKFVPNDQLAKGKPGILINGVVYEKPGGQPLPGAVVMIPGTNRSTTTNANGEFALSADSSAQSLSIGYVGFTSKQVEAKAGQPVKVGLEADQNALNEVAIVVGGGKAKAVRPVPTPANGWSAFLNYLAENNRLLKKGVKPTGTVQVTFTVKKDGRPADIKIKKGLTKIENDEAIRLINEGPNWILLPNARRTTEVSIGF